MSGDVLALFNEQIAQVTKIDNVFDSLEDSATAGKRKITNELIAGVQDKVQGVVDDLISRFNGVEDPELRFPMFLALSRALDKAFGKAADEFVTSKVPAPTETDTEKPTISDEQKKTLQDSRKNLTERARVLGGMAVDLGLMTQEELEERLPKRRNLSGPRGKRAISYYTLTVGETTYDTIAEVAKANGYEKSSELTKAIRETGEKINLTNPPREFSFQLKNGQTLKAVDTRTDEQRGESESTDSDSDDSDETDED